MCCPAKCKLQLLHDPKKVMEIDFKTASSNNIIHNVNYACSWDISVCGNIVFTNSFILCPKLVWPFAQKL